MAIRMDSFSGAAADLKGQQRTCSNVLAALNRNPRVSTFDMSEHGWLRSCIAELQRLGFIAEDKREPYPWHKFTPTTPEDAD